MLILFVYFVMDACLLFVMFDFAFQEIVLEEIAQNDLFCVWEDVKS